MKTSSNIGFTGVRPAAHRTTVLSRVTALRRAEPWPGYDELTIAEIEAILGEGDDQHVKDVVAYERAHKNRAGVLKAAERDTANHPGDRGDVRLYPGPERRGAHAIGQTRQLPAPAGRALQPA